MMCAEISVTLRNDTGVAGMGEPLLPARAAATATMPDGDGRAATQAGDPLWALAGRMHPLRDWLVGI